MKIVRYGIAIGLLTGPGACADMMGGPTAADAGAARNNPPPTQPDSIPPAPAPQH